jgi:catechol 2,3-dioxygenase-like lactoylglutathione lyase family enzyme
MLKARTMATIPAQDIDRAKAWYAEKLDLTPVGMDPLGGALYELSEGSRFLLFPSTGASAGSHTQMALEVEDPETTIRGLRGRGVKFEDYDVPGLKTVDGIATVGELKASWFKDSEGNLISIGSRVPVTAPQRS